LKKNKAPMSFSFIHSLKKLRTKYFNCSVNNKRKSSWNLTQSVHTYLCVFHMEWKTPHLKTMINRLAWYHAPVIFNLRPQSFCPSNNFKPPKESWTWTSTSVPDHAHTYYIPNKILPSLAIWAKQQRRSVLIIVFNKDKLAHSNGTVWVFCLGCG
jgi:hypothetical protein